MKVFQNNMHDENHFTQQRLVQSLKGNQRVAFEYFYDHYSPGLYGIIGKIIPDQKIASEILQEALLSSGKIWGRMMQKGGQFSAGHSTLQEKKQYTMLKPRCSKIKYDFRLVVALAN